MTGHDLRELYVLQRVFGIGAEEALYVRPGWELDNLLTQFRREEQERANSSA